MRDVVVEAAITLGFATAVTVHVAIAARLLLRQRPRWKGLLAFFVPPLAVLWALRAGWRRSAALWMIAVVIYIAALIAALT